MLEVIEPHQSVHLILGPTDMRKSIDGLCALVKYFLDEEPVSDKLFVFCNRSRDKIKILQLAQDVDCFEFLDALELVVLSSNLGDNRTLGIPVAHTIYYEMGPERRASMGVSDGMVRLSIGIEDLDDLIADFTHALS